MTDYDSTTLNPSELKTLAESIANNSARPFEIPWTYDKKVYETVETQHKSGGFFGFMQKTTTTSEQVRRIETCRIFGDHWLLGERSECRSEQLSSSREFGAVREELIETTIRYVLLPTGELARGMLVTDTLVRHMRDDDFSVEEAKAVPFEERDFLALDVTDEVIEQQVSSVQTLTGNMRGNQVCVEAKGDGLRNALNGLL